MKPIGPETELSWFALSAKRTLSAMEIPSEFVAVINVHENVLGKNGIVSVAEKSSMLS